MNISQIFALGVFNSYFLLIIGLFSLILKSLPKPKLNTNKIPIITFVILVLVSFAHTWYYMLGFMAWSFSDYEKSVSSPKEQFSERVASWLVDTALFEQAWGAVCFDPINWWWSEQVCLFAVGAWTVFLATEGAQHRIRYLWAYMLLGQTVAISVASNLFYLALTLSESHSLSSKKKTPLRMAPPELWISILISLVAVGATPFTTERTFLPNLLIMHALLLLPLVSFTRLSLKQSNRFAISVQTLYGLILAISLAMRLRTTFVAITSLPDYDQSVRAFFFSAWRILHSHPAQSSIGWDVIWTSISFVIWISTRPSTSVDVPYLLLASPLASVGVTAPYVLLSEDGDNESKKS